MNQKVFPISTATSCQLKWNWSTIFLYSGRTFSCHRTAMSIVDTDNFDTFHNTALKLSDRQAMLEGKWPEKSCSYCRDLEQAGNYSDRQLHRTIPYNVPMELDNNPSAVEVTPTILEVYFNNTCNLACLYCSPWLSSKINQENIQHGTFDQNGIKLEPFTLKSDYSGMVEKFWQWMIKNGKNLQRLHVLGGEPFYQDEFEKCLDYFEKNPHPNLEVNIVTNLMVTESRLEYFVLKFKKLLADRQLRRIDITCSIDCIGPEQEFVRYGLDLNVWFKNFEKLMTHRWLTLNINQTVSILTIKTMPELLEKLNEWRQQRPIGHFFSEITPHPSYLKPSVLGDIFSEDFEKILSLISEPNSRSYMSSIASKISKSVPDANELKKLQTFLNEKDRRRGTNWRETFPWLEKELNNVV